MAYIKTFESFSNEFIDSVNTEFDKLLDLIDSGENNDELKKSISLQKFKIELDKQNNQNEIY